MSDRDPGATFDPGEICWFDFEARSGEDLTKSGATRYACDPDAAAIILAYAVGRGPVQLVTAPTPGEALVWGDLPSDFRVHYLGGKFAAFNAGFDRAIWNYALPGSPYLPPGGVIDPSVQAVASGLPPDLKSACEATGSLHKVADGGALIGLFCLADSIATPTSHPEEWQRFLNYAAGDVEAMRSLFLHTRQISRQEWNEYWTMEAINERGVTVDLDMCRHANTLSRETKARGGVELHQLTRGIVSSVNGVRGLTDWLRTTLPPDGVRILTRREEEEDEDGTVTRKGRYSLTRSRIEKLIPYCESIGYLDAARALNIRLYGGSTTPAKFDKILKQHVDGKLYGQYVFNGAPQTGRASSRGVQVHNLIRSALPYEHDAIEALLEGCDYDSFAALGDTTPVARKLALLIRPTFIPSSPLNVFVWSDWAQIEARILPWLVGDVPGAVKRLQIFRDVDADPRTPDIYVRTAADISGVLIDLVDEALRQRGKVAELALGFGAGVGALAAMGAAYGLYLPEDDAKEVVKRWRAANPWCVRFWGSHTEDSSIGLWGAANRAMERPGKIQRTGRISYIYLKSYLGGSLLCRLPSGRFLTYRGIKYERVNDLDDDGNVIGSSIKLRFWKGRNRAVIWHGTLCIAEGTPVLTEHGWLPIEQITTERVWDGDDWVRQDGVICNGVRDVIELDGAWMTPDHLYMSKEGWKRAEERDRFDRAAVRFPDGLEFRRDKTGQASLVRSVRLRQREYNTRYESNESARCSRLPFMQHERQEYDTRHDRPSSVLGMALDARPLPIADPSSMEELRRTWDHSVPGVGDVRSILARHGSGLSEWPDDRTREQRSRVLKNELLLGNIQGAGTEPAWQSTHRYAVGEDDSVTSVGTQRHRRNDAALPTKCRRTRVYDILNAGPKNQFVIAGVTAPTIVHNCENVVQATAADILRGTLARLENTDLPVRLHTHDEIVLEVPEADADYVTRELRRIMQQGFDWTEGLPLMSEETVRPYYSKWKRPKPEKTS